MMHACGGGLVIPSSTLKALLRSVCVYMRVSAVCELQWAVDLHGSRAMK